jgi:two-component system, OmpR family, response regulator QseB
MRVACLILEDAVFANCLGFFGDYGLTAVRFTSELRLLRALRTDQIDAVLVDVGADAALESRIFACVQRVAVGRVPFVLQTIDRQPQRNALALRAGIADVVTRGTEAVEVAARLVAAARRSCHGENATTLAHAGFVLDRVNMSATDRTVPVDLTPREFALAWLLFSNEGQCVSRRVISLAVWGVESEVSSRTMEQHIHQVRKKLGLGPARGVTVSAVYGAGYLLAVHAPAAPPAAPASAGGPKAATSPELHFAVGDASLAAGFKTNGSVHPAQVTRIDWMLAGPGVTR